MEHLIISMLCVRQMHTYMDIFASVYVNVDKYRCIYMWVCTYICVYMHIDIYLSYVDIKYQVLIACKLLC